MRLSSIILAALILVGQTGSLTAKASSAILINSLITGSAAPLAPQAKDDAGFFSSKRAKTSRVAHIASSSIQNPELAIPSFAEYSVDWSAWMKNVGDNWSKSFSQEAKRQKLHGVTDSSIEVTCLSDGTIMQINIRRGSGDDRCDAINVYALKRLGKLPSFPSCARVGELTFVYVWQYNATAATKLSRARTALNGSSSSTLSISGQQM